MAIILSELQSIDGARFGEQLRTPVSDALTKINNDIDPIVNTVFHRCYFRGKELGSGATFEVASTVEQRNSIQNGTFDDIFIGDYWTINSKIFRVADINYWLHIGDTSFETNHLVIVPDLIMGSDKMNTENITTGAYVGSEMYTDSESALNKARTTISNLFGNYLGTHRAYFANTVTNGAESKGAWFDSSVDLMSEIMVYGSKIRSKANDGSYIATSDKSQLALFNLAPKFMHQARQYVWLRDVVSSATFATVHYPGYATHDVASISIGVRPCFPLVVPSE